MMNHCKIVEDLLPLYADELTNQESSEYVRRHLEKCPACAQAHRRMASPLLEQKQIDIPDYKKHLRRSIFGIVLQTVGLFILAAGLYLYVLWETGLAFAPEKKMESADGNKWFAVRYYDEAGFFNRGGAYVVTPDGKGRDYRGDENFIDACAYWAPNNSYYFVHYTFTDHDESFYWGYDAPPEPLYDDNGNLIGHHASYWDRAYPDDNDFYGYLKGLCRAAIAPTWDRIKFEFVQWSDASDAMCFSFFTDDGQSGLLWYSIQTNTIEQIIS